MAMTPKELADAQVVIARELQNLPDVFVECRGMQHAWEAQSDFRVINPAEDAPKRSPRFLRRDLRCMRGCGTVRSDTFLLNFVKGEPRISEKLHASYIYPEGYKISGIPRGMKRQTVVYQEQWRRQMDSARKAINEADNK